VFRCPLQNFDTPAFADLSPNPSYLEVSFHILAGSSAVAKVLVVVRTPAKVCATQGLVHRAQQSLGPVVFAALRSTLFVAALLTRVVARFHVVLRVGGFLVAVFILALSLAIMEHAPAAQKWLKFLVIAVAILRFAHVASGN
jgi:hypothetical protein